MELEEIPWLSAIGVLILIPQLLAYDFISMPLFLINALFLIALGLELSGIRIGTAKSALVIQTTWMALVWGLYQLLALNLIPLGAMTPMLNMLLMIFQIFLGIQYVMKTSYVDLPYVVSLDASLLILAAFSFVHLIMAWSLIGLAVFTVAAGYLMKENAYEYTRFLPPLGTLIAGYSIFLLL